MQDIKYLPFLLAGVALITGLFLAVVVGAIAAIAQWARPWIWGLATFALVGAGSWLILLGWWRSLVERINGVEICPTNGGFSVQPETVKVEVIDHQPGGYISGDYLDFPISQNQLIALGTALENGASFSHASLAGPGRVLSRSEYETVRDLFIGAGLVRWIDPRYHNRGLELTGAGRSLTRRFASMSDQLPQLERRFPISDIS